MKTFIAICFSCLFIQEQEDEMPQKRLIKIYESSVVSYETETLSLFTDSSYKFEKWTHEVGTAIRDEGKFIMNKDTLVLNSNLKISRKIKPNEYSKEKFYLFKDEKFQMIDSSITNNNTTNKNLSFKRWLKWRDEDISKENERLFGPN